MVAVVDILPHSRRAALGKEAREPSPRPFSILRRFLDSGDAVARNDAFKKAVPLPSLCRNENRRAMHALSAATGRLEMTHLRRAVPLSSIYGSVEESAGLGVIISALEVIETCFGWVLPCTRRGCPPPEHCFSVCTC